MKKLSVTIVYKSLPQYRAPFYERVRELCAERGIDFRLCVGQPIGADRTKDDSVSLPWAEFRRSRVLNVRGRSIIWQPFLRVALQADLVVVEQASKLLLNYALLLARKLGIVKVAFWGHGRNFQTSTASPLGERLKRRASVAVDWWFAYNDASAEVVRGELGFPSDRITSLRNTIDTVALSSGLAKVQGLPAAEVRSLAGVKSANVALYIGGLYREKRLSFLLEAAMSLRELVPDFELLVVGAGPELSLIEEAALEHPWIHSVRPTFGGDRAVYFACSKFLMFPGLVGLAVIDSFVARTPMVTIDLPDHSPEISYLQHGINGCILPAGTTPLQYAEYAAELLANDRSLQTLRSGCERSEPEFSLDGMATRFVDGAERAIRG